MPTGHLADDWPVLARMRTCHAILLRGWIVHRSLFPPAERQLAGYAGEDAVIRFYKNPDEWQGWTGERQVVICFSQIHLPSRKVECNYDTLLNVTHDLPCELFGPRNEEAQHLCADAVVRRARRDVRSSRVCFHTGTFPASYTLGFIEAWMTGIPVVAVGSRLFSRILHLARAHELPDLIEHEVNGFISDDVNELKSCLRCVLCIPTTPANSLLPDAVKRFGTSARRRSASNGGGFLPTMLDCAMNSASIPSICLQHLNCDARGNDLCSESARRRWATSTRDKSTSPHNFLVLLAEIKCRQNVSHMRPSGSRATQQSFLASAESQWSVDLKASMPPAHMPLISGIGDRCAFCHAGNRNRAPGDR